jgi:cobyrinic acid a,c-diamide synthase
MAALVVAASHSGAGKTTVTGAVLTGLRRRGLTVQAFKLGPDFIDPAYHTEATGRSCINLDLWMMGIEGVRDSFRRWSRDADISVIEAMGALHDGANGTDEGSAAHLAKLLGLPVVVVLDVWGMTRTTGAILDGLIKFDPDVEIAGCILNRTGSPAHARMILESLPEESRRLVLGTIGNRADLAIGERHLGLMTVHENPTPPSVRRAALTAAADNVDIDRIIRIAATHATAVAAPATHQPNVRIGSRRARLAIAMDDVFCFYYEENLALLREAGFELVPFSPTADRCLPADTAAVYLGGGYPESALAALADNTELAAELRRRVTDGMPLHAECGGLMYLARSVTSVDGSCHRLAGVLPIDIVMEPTHLAIGYADVTTRVDSPLGPAGTTARGQEFHQSRVVRSDIRPNLYDVRTSTGTTISDGFALHNVTASYIHLHLASNPAIATHLVAAAPRT